MARMAMGEIGDMVRRGLDDSFLASSVADVEVEPEDESDDFPMALVLVSVRKPDKVDVRALNELVHRIRHEVMANEGPFLVFRFPEAA